MGMKIGTFGRVFLYTGAVLLVLGLIKAAAPDVWSKIPGLKEF